MRNIYVYLTNTYVENHTIIFGAYRATCLSNNLFYIYSVLFLLLLLHITFDDRLRSIDTIAHYNATMLTIIPSVKTRVLIELSGLDTSCERRKCLLLSSHMSYTFYGCYTYRFQLILLLRYAKRRWSNTCRFRFDITEFQGSSMCIHVFNRFCFAKFD